MSQSCRVRPNPATPLQSGSFWVVIGMIWIDLSLTFVGITEGIGEEANPFYAWFTQQNPTWMIVGVVLYITIILLWFHISPDWIRTITTGFLITIHTYGAMSWARNWFETFGVFFDFFWLIVGPALLGSIFTFWTWVELTSCPGVGSEEKIEYI